ncbi:MAG: hypothetical protein CAK90_05575 [Spartobacteria bacterium AMD-G4]|nr:MAG: hypothetical protein CAK90_05575 [Spartobacteria bacterium AMD-G4]
MPNKFCLFDHAISLSLIIAALSTASVVTAQENDTRQMRRGAIIITEVQGKVLIIKPGETEGKNASKAQALQQGERVMTDKDSTISLAFENGSVIQVEPETSFIVEEFLQAPWDVSEAALSEMKTEPSNSKLSTFLEYGDVTSGVKKLKPGSSLTVATPFGTAGILGTDFKVSLQRDAKGGSKGLSVAVASGEVAVATKGGATTSVKGGFSTSVSVIPSTNGQGSSMSQPTTTQIAAEVSLSILQLVRNQRTSAAQVFTNNLLERAISPSSGLNTRQTNTIEDAAAIGKEALLTTVEQLSADRVSAAPKIAAYATGLNPEAAAEIAAAAAKGASQVAVQIALAVTFTAPSQAAQIATSVATTVPNAAPRIAAVVASAVPSQAAQIAASVAAALPSAATAIARSVARAQRQQLEEIIQTTSQAVPESAASISSEVQAEAEDQGVGDGQEASSQIDLPPVIPTNPTQPPPPAPAPTSTPTPPTPTPPSPTATPPPTPTPTPTPNPSNA